MKKLLVAAAMLVAGEVEAQQIGCFFDFTTQQCEGGVGGSYQIFNDFVTNQLHYGFVMAQAIETYRDEWQNCEAQRSEVINTYNQTAVDFNYLLSENEKLLKLIKRLRRKISSRG